MFQFGLVPTTNKPTRKTKDTISALDHIIANSTINNSFKSTILKIKLRLIFVAVIHCSKQRLWLGYFIYFKCTALFF